MDTEARLVGRDVAVRQQHVQLEPLLPLGLAGQQFEQVGAADQLFQTTYAQLGQPLARLFGDEAEEVDHHLGQADEVFLAQRDVLRRDAGGAVVEVADAQVLAAQRDHRRGAEAEALGPQDRRLDHIEAGLETAVSLHQHTTAQAVGTQHLLRLGETQLPRRAGVLDAG